MLKPLFQYLGGIITQIPSDFLLGLTGLTFLFFIMIIRTDLRNEKSARQKALLGVSSFLVRKSLSVGFAANRIKSHIETKKN